MEEAPDNSKELSHSAHADGMNKCWENLSFIKMWQEWRVLYLEILVHVW
jgi:hypothetical protein